MSHVNVLTLRRQTDSCFKTNKRQRTPCLKRRFCWGLERLLSIQRRCLWNPLKMFSYVSTNFECLRWVWVTLRRAVQKQGCRTLELPFPKDYHLNVWEKCFLLSSFYFWLHNFASCCLHCPSGSCHKFDAGFAWEVLEVFSGPPNVTWNSGLWAPSNSLCSASGHLQVETLWENDWHLYRQARQGQCSQILSPSCLEYLNTAFLDRSTRATERCLT